METRYIVHHKPFNFDIEYINSFGTFEEAEKFAEETNDARYERIYIEIGHDNEDCSDLYDIEEIFG